MDSRRLVVWIAAGILGFQGATLVLDLLNCSVLTWLYVRRFGLEQGLQVQSQAIAQRPPEGLGQPEGLGKPESLRQPEGPGQPERLGPPQGPSGTAPALQGLTQPQPEHQPLPRAATPTAATPSTGQQTPPQPSPRPLPLDPTEVFCNRPRSRVDAAVGQGLTILAGLALGGSVGGGGKGEQP